MPGHLWEFLLCRLVSSLSPECIPAALGCLSPSPPSLIVLASLETPSENTCSRFSSVLLVLKMARKWLCPDGSNGTPAKKKKESTRRSLCQKDATTEHTKIKRHYLWWRCNFFDSFLGLFSLF